MKSPGKYFKRKLEAPLEGRQKKLSQLSVIITVLAGIFYIIFSCYIITSRPSQTWLYRNLGTAFMVGVGVSTGGVGFILTRPPKQRIYWAIFIFLFLILFSFYPTY